MEETRSVLFCFLFIFIDLFIFLFCFYKLDSAQRTRMPPPRKLKCKLLMPSRMKMKTDGRMDKGNTVCSFHHSLNGRA